MKKLIIPLLLIINTVNASHAQVKECTYEVPREGDSLCAIYSAPGYQGTYISLYLYNPSSTYVIDYSVIFYDMITTTPYSTGSYTINDNKITLYDPVLNMTMDGELSENGKTLAFLKSFVAMRETVYKGTFDNLSIYDLLDLITRSNTGVNAKIESYKKPGQHVYSLPKSICLHNVVSDWENNVMSDKIILDENNGFQFNTAEGIAVLSGTYEQINNLILLHDDSTGAVFYLGIIDEKSVEALLLPDLYRKKKIYFIK